MHLSDSTLVFAATDVSGFLACPHLTTLNQARANCPPARFAPSPPPGTSVTVHWIPVQKEGCNKGIRVD